MTPSYWTIPGIYREAPTQDSIINAVCKYFNITKDQLTQKTRKREIVEARQVACVLIRKNFPRLSYEKIGNMLGGLNHATMIHAIKKVDNMLATDKAFIQTFNRIKNEI